MSVHAAMKHNLGTGSITGESEQSYVVPYYVYTDNTDSPEDIYAAAISGVFLVDVYNNRLPEKLPIYGSVKSNSKVSDIRIERVSENNLKAVPQYGLAYKIDNTSYTCWQYTVTFIVNVDISEEPPWEKDEATSCVWSPKSYERYDSLTLKPNFASQNDTVSVPVYPLGNAQAQTLVNTVGDDVYRNRTVYNYVLNFSYAVHYFDYMFLPLYLSSMNLNDVVIAGIPIKKYNAVINELRVSQAEWNDELYYNVDVEIEVQYNQRLNFDEYVSSGYRAFMLEGSQTAIDEYLADIGLTKETAGFVYKYTNSEEVKKYPVPIQELTDVRIRDEVPENRWFIKKKNLGYFENINLSKNTKSVAIPNNMYLANSGDEVGVTDTITVTTWAETESGTPAMDYTTLYLMKDSDGRALLEDDGYVYSIYPGAMDTQYSCNLRYVIDKHEPLLKVRVLKYASRPINSQESNDPFAGQYNSIQTPIALNKYGGVYLAEGETSTIDDSTEPAKIDMYDPMLGKVKDYQHIARDWTALAFPRKGMFYSTGRQQ